MLVNELAWHDENILAAPVPAKDASGDAGIQWASQGSVGDAGDLPETRSSLRGAGAYNPLLCHSNVCVIYL